jgi:HAD superfamily hydrolase (TIGR01509 family)
MLKALIFDVDGTMADSESVHREAFNAAFAQEGLDWVWDEPLYTRLLEISGGKERMTYYWKTRHPDMVDISADAMRDTIASLHDLKAAAYGALVQQGAVPLRPGVQRMVEEAHQQGMMLAIATTTSSLNIAALMRKAIGPDWQHYFAVVEDASTAPLKKPHPQVYLQALQRLGLPARDCLAVEDSANGLRAALAANLPVLITHNRFTAHHDFSGAVRVLPDLSDTTLADLRAWHEEAILA